ncbi:MAG: sulfite exporter TauE/SafE family protein [Clostridiales bacterium]|jgi:uncharacterized membrane protein YfcA|nr:sulfite exporter TauE/SafE family protein [Clostridiales bacterium]
MTQIFYILIGIAGGVLGGMGMGGGTLLIPMLTLFMHTEQHAAQGVNLVAFVPMSIIALIIHIKNKLIEKRVILPLLLSAAVMTAVGALVSLKTDTARLKIYFGIFLTLLGGAYMAAPLIKKIRNKKN